MDLTIPEIAHVIIPLLCFSIWFTCNGIVSKNMIDYREKDNEYFSGFKWTIKDYTFRFFHLFYFPFSIYSLQKEIKQGIENEKIS